MIVGGVRASRLGRVLAERAGAQLDRAGRVIVEPDLSVPGHPAIFVIADLSMQQVRYVARLLQRRLAGRATRNRAVAEFGKLHIAGFDVTRNRGARLITGGKP